MKIGKSWPRFTPQPLHTRHATTAAIEVAVQDFRQTQGDCSIAGMSHIHMLH